MDKLDKIDEDIVFGVASIMKKIGRIMPNLVWSCKEKIGGNPNKRVDHVESIE